MNGIGIFAFVGSLGGAEVTIIIFAILLLFGAKRIPELARGLGRGIREFKDATNEIKSELDKSVQDKDQKK
ncbi:Sec-independent protein translocase subunit TatA/TatB [Pontibacter ramchanderi]|uniref:Sec-independent protein translocase protein TatA n=1 Tax=Pontibacter ramchanderi TaxID=1179743 RepID=A0A2N3V0K6_9BACT|nr:twin-arginine translocase TatA/TatE family subunit [Pontibacter ramchanderi]PKV75148.1 sec-independent protein translocase protein TatA [Pontibacter ramchanderi]